MTPRGTICPACHGTALRPAFRRSALSFERCRSCGTVFDPTPPTEAELSALYEGKAYFVKEAGSEGGPAPVGAADLWGYPADYLADRRFVEAKFDEVLRHLERYVPVGRLLDVGAGPGFLVSAASARGWDAVGLDLNEWAAEHARDEVGVDVRVGRLDEHAFAGERFDAVTMMDVVEHVADPDALLANAARLVRPGGVLVLLTPDAGAPVSRILGGRWPEVRRPGEHVVLYSRRGLTDALRRHGFTASGWHSTGKVAAVSTLLDDAAAAAPRAFAAARCLVADRAVGERVVELDPRTKFVVYARRAPDAATAPRHRPARVPKRPGALADVDEAILEELEHLAAARRYGAWLYDTFAEHVDGARVLEVGAGIGTFTQRMLDAGARELLLIEPEERCADVLDKRFADDHARHRVPDLLPDAPCLAAADGTFDLVVCQNVLEHIGDDTSAVGAMARALRPGGHLALVVPAGPRLFGALDDAYGHWRRYDRATLRTTVESAGLEVASLQPMNGPGIVAWWLKNRRPGARVGSGSLRAYEVVVAAWRPLEDRLGAPVGLTLACVARRPDPTAPTGRSATALG